LTRQFLAVGHHVEERRAGMGENVADRPLQLARILDPRAVINGRGDEILDLATSNLRR
jgi:hypothetical protein